MPYYTGLWIMLGGVMIFLVFFGFLAFKSGAVRK